MPLGHRTIIDGLKVVGYAIWRQRNDSRSDAPERDPIYDQHLEFLAHHPGFAVEVAQVPLDAPEEVLRALAGRWQITLADLRCLIDRNASSLALTGLSFGFSYATTNTSSTFRCTSLRRVKTRSSLG